MNNKKSPFLDRKKGPLIHPIARIQAPIYEVETWSNGTQFITINLGTQALTNIEIIHKGGRLLEHKKGIAKAVARLLKEGSQSFDSKQIADTIDFYGASLATGANLDYSYIKLFSLNRYLPNLLPLLKEIRFNPTFPDEELKKYQENNIEKLKIELIKNDVVAYRTFTAELFGTDHPYGYNSTIEVYQNITRDDLIHYFDENYGSDNCIIILSGQIDSKTKEAVRKNFGDIQHRTPSIKYVNPAPIEFDRVILDTGDKNQSTIKMGFPLYGRSHPDYASMYVLNTLVGGYFGSRLMKKIREEKGFTYGIYSSLDTMIYDGYLSISTDVNNANVFDTLSIVYDELDQLCHSQIDPKELKMVKNYINGNLLNLIDGPFRIASMAKVIALNDLPLNFYERLSSQISEITVEQLKKLATDTFLGKTMKEVIVGNPE